MPSRAVVGCLGDDRYRRSRESLGWIQARCRARAVQDENVFNTTAAELADEEWEGRAAQSTGDAHHRPTVHDAESVPQRPECVELIAGLQFGEQSRAGA